MKPQLGYIPVESVYPHQGLNTQVPSTLLNPHFSPSMQNISVLDGMVTKRKGCTFLGGQSGFGVPVMAMINFQTVTGLNYLVAITTTKQYYYQDSTDTWINITKQVTGVDSNLTGDETNLVSHVEVTGTDTGKILIFTNGVDKPRYWDGDPTHKFADVLFNYPNFVTCKTLATQNDRLIMGAITDTVYTPQNVAWSDAGKVNEWLSGTAGVQSLFNTDGEVWALVPLADAMVVYAENSIHMMNYVGGDAIYVFQKLLSDTRLVSQNSVVNLGPFHVFLNQDNIQLFDGSRTVVPVGDAIHLTYRDSLYIAKRYRAYGFLDRARKRVYFGVPVTSNTLSHYVLEYDLLNSSNQRWYLDVYGTGLITTMGFYVSNTTINWNSVSLAATIWSGYLASWSAGNASKGFPSRVLGDIAGATYTAGGVSPDDAGTAIDSFWESMDFAIPQEYQSELMRVQQVELEVMGTGFSVSYSTDQGLSYTSIQSVVPTRADWVTYRMFFDTVARTIRFKISNSSLTSTFSFRWLRVWFTPTGPY